MSEIVALATIADAAVDPELLNNFEDRKVIELKHGGAERYQRLAAARLKAIRMTAGLSLEQMSSALADVLGYAVSARQLEAWEAGTESFFAGLLPAALDVAGVTEAEIIALNNPDIDTINRLECAIARVRGLLNDPAALTRRAAEILEGRARPLHPIF